MRYKVVAVRDRAADVYGTPFYQASIGAAIRSFSDEINNGREGNVLGKHPEDFDLYELGEYDDADGTFHCGFPKQIAVGKDLAVRV